MNKKLYTYSIGLLFIYAALFLMVMPDKAIAQEGTTQIPVNNSMVGASGGGKSSFGLTIDKTQYSGDTLKETKTDLSTVLENCKKGVVDPLCKDDEEEKKKKELVAVAGGPQPAVPPPGAAVVAGAGDKTLGWMGPTGFGGGSPPGEGEEEPSISPEDSWEETIDPKTGKKVMVAKAPPYDKGVTSAPPKAPPPTPTTAPEGGFGGTQAHIPFDPKAHTPSEPEKSAATEPSGEEGAAAGPSEDEEGVGKPPTPEEVKEMRPKDALDGILEGFKGMAKEAEEKEKEKEKPPQTQEKKSSEAAPDQPQADQKEKLRQALEEGREAIRVGDTVYLPPSANGEIRVKTAQEYEQQVGRRIGQLKELLEKDMPQALRELSSYWDRATSFWGAETTPAEAQFDAALAAINKTLKELRDLGYSGEEIGRIRKQVIDALETSKKSIDEAFGKLRNVVVAVIAAPIAVKIAVGAAGVKAAAVVKTVIAAGQGVTIFNAGVESIRHNSNIFKNYAEATSTTGAGSIILAPAIALVPLAASGAGTTAVYYGASTATGATITVTLDTVAAAYFTKDMVASGISGGKETYDLFKKADEAEKAGDHEGAARFRTDAIKAMGQVGLDITFLTVGVGHLGKSAIVVARKGGKTVSPPTPATTPAKRGVGEPSYQRSLKDQISADVLSRLIERTRLQGGKTTGTPAPATTIAKALVPKTGGRVPKKGLISLDKTKKGIGRILDQRTKLVEHARKIAAKEAAKAPGSKTVERVAEGPSPAPLPKPSAAPPTKGSIAVVDKNGNIVTEAKNFPELVGKNSTLAERTDLKRVNISRDSKGNIVEITEDVVSPTGAAQGYTKPVSPEVFKKITGKERSSSAPATTIAKAPTPLKTVEKVAAEPAPLPKPLAPKTSRSAAFVDKNWKILAEGKGAGDVIVKNPTLADRKNIKILNIERDSKGNIVEITEDVISPTGTGQGYGRPVKPQVFKKIAGYDRPTTAKAPEATHPKTVEKAAAEPKPKGPEPTPTPAPAKVAAAPKLDMTFATAGGTSNQNVTSPPKGGIYNAENFHGWCTPERTVRIVNTSGTEVQIGSVSSGKSLKNVLTADGTRCEAKLEGVLLTITEPKTNQSWRVDLSSCPMAGPAAP